MADYFVGNGATGTETATGDAPMATGDDQGMGEVSVSFWVIFRIGVFLTFLLVSNSLLRSIFGEQMLRGGYPD